MSGLTVETARNERRSLDAATPDRLGGACGVAFTALMVAAAVIVPPPPESDAPAASIRDYLTSHAGGLSVNTLLVGAAAMAVIGFFALVHRRLRLVSADAGVVPGVFLLAAGVAVTCTLLGAVIQAALVHQIARAADSSVVGGFYALWDRIFHTAPSMGMAVALLAASIAGLRWRVLPRWVSLLGLASAALMAIDIAEDLVSTGTNLGPLGLVAFGLANVWIVAVSVTAWRRPDVAATTEA